MTLIDDWPRFVRMVFRSTVRWSVGMYGMFFVSCLLRDEPLPRWDIALLCVGFGVGIGCIRWFAEQANAPLHKP